MRPRVIQRDILTIYHGFKILIMPYRTYTRFRDQNIENRRMFTEFRRAPSGYKGSFFATVIYIGFEFFAAQQTYRIYEI